MDQYEDSKGKERLITATNYNTDNIKISRTTINKKQKWEEKQLYGYLKRPTDEISYEKIGYGKKRETLKSWISSDGGTKKRHKDLLS